MLRAGKAVSQEELLNQVWGFESAAETRATDDAIRRLRRKIDGSQTAIGTVWGYGFRLEAEKRCRIRDRILVTLLMLTAAVLLAEI